MKSGSEAVPAAVNSGPYGYLRLVTCPHYSHSLVRLATSYDCYPLQRLGAGIGFVFSGVTLAYTLTPKGRASAGLSWFSSFSSWYNA